MIEHNCFVVTEVFVEVSFVERELAKQFHHLPLLVDLLSTLFSSMDPN